ncbi:MAG: FMN-binding glutamate synthase family protein, partial [Planctomycetota bacterium]|nr:FMN-binding glutamate synthase family protein [Planctomycetota bacterium]
QDPHLVRGLDVTDKRTRVANFHKATVHAFLEMLGAAGLSHPNQLTPWHVQRRVSRAKILSYAEIYLMLKPGELLKPPYPDRYVSWMEMATPDSFTMQCRLPVRA